jgi:hypothetical protein
MSGPTTVVANRNVFIVTPELSAAPRTMTVTVKSDGNREWTFEEPGWRALGFGVAGPTFYLWSARRLIAFGGDGRSEPEFVVADEDLVTAFLVPDGWLLVCETSVRLLGPTLELARVELGEVVAEAWLEGSELIVRNLTGAKTRVHVGTDKLTT